MHRLQNFAPLFAIAAALVLLAATIGLIVYADGAAYRARAARVAVQDTILASTVTAALAFNDSKTAQEYVSALAADPSVVAAAIYGLDGALVAAYARDPGSAPPTRAVPLGSYDLADRLIAVEPVIQNDKLLGSAYLETTTVPRSRRVERDGVIAAVAVMASLLIVALGLAQGALRRANAELEKRAEELTEVNDNLRQQIEARARIEAVLRQAQKMEAIGQLTGGVAHDFNNLLQVIIGNLDLLRRRIASDAAELRRPVEAATRGAERAATLIHNLLAFARRQPLAPRPIDVNRLIAGMSDFLRQTLGETVQVESAPADGLWPVAADATQLETAILNLAVNSRHAMHAGGRFIIETKNTRLEAESRSGEEITAGEYVMIAVTDTGTGMAPEIASRAFDPFFTTKETGKGSGLGLSQVYGFLRQSGGHATIDSTEDRGTTVRLYLPRLVEEPPAVTVHGEPRRAPHGHANELILVVEDNSDVREHTIGLLRELDYRVIAAADGPEALRELTLEDGVGLLLTDVGLPGTMNGHELAEAARRLRPGLPVLYTSGYARDALARDGRLEPGVELVTKPFTFATLARKVRQVLDEEHGADPDAGPRG
ncbi:MAG: ATP-binding protein [Stellaceae bacterium]